MHEILRYKERVTTICLNFKPLFQTNNEEFNDEILTYKVISPNNIDGAMKLVLAAFVKNLKRSMIHEKILNILVMLRSLMESRLKSVMSRVALDLFSMIEKWIVIPFNVMLKQKNGLVSSIWLRNYNAEKVFFRYNHSRLKF